ncbi:MAG: type IV pilus twitching motility protein PilT [Deltaproteobacteria bacterium]|nr:type IV pilus twitching motility protein PilT [Deltaproteobacteria bacterium]MBI3388664.1 type IV pilus twitching motility protein PilT [Deltaproteobacteria bacterium]
MDITQLLTFAHQQGASDVHLSAGEPPMLRLHGDMKRLEHAALGAEETRHMVFDIMSDSVRKAYDETHDVDFSFELGDLARFRVNVFRQRKGDAAVFRLIPSKVMTMDQLSLPPILKDICEKEKGLVLVTGPTGSGKSTTLAAMIDFINITYEGHILTIEDPIEFVHESKKCLINQRELGPHTQSFANALRGALREDPDVILVGEMRDLETISLALTAAETGHLVFATVHTSSAPKTVDRVIDVFPAAQQEQIRTMFAESIQAVITQTLLKQRVGGRIAALEILMGTPAVRNLIREGKVHQLPSAMQTGQNVGMQTLDMALVDLVNKNMVTIEEAQSKTLTPNLFKAAGGEARAKLVPPPRSASPLVGRA